MSLRPQRAQRSLLSVRGEPRLVYPGSKLQGMGAIASPEPTAGHWLAAGRSARGEGTARGPRCPL